MNARALNHDLLSNAYVESAIYATMTRKKVKLAYITNDSARKATFKKRKKGLMKKVSELSTLCGIEACAIICSPYDAQPEVWPSPLGVQRVLSQFQKLPEMEQSKKMMNQESFLRQRITKASDNLKKQRKDNREKEVTQAMFQCLTGKSLQNLNLMDLNDLGWMIDQNLKEIHKRSSTFQNVTTSQMAAASMAGPSGEHASQRAEVQIFEVKNDNMQRQQWIMDFLTPQEPLGFGGPDEMMLPFVDNNHNPLWSNTFFP
ncbi:hypothetical protein SADUNF_Sadunf13G0015800 [Salix dunnii]|uniref:MADS-box domain-containing protein n=1 Tax=Salix dunnii TaxID=1413687 RepID=A0A835JK87_9ROSI|nr:hypothetical protein SADUNF_Sadunf13G0015800 [Salix dunnii]